MLLSACFCISLPCLWNTVPSFLQQGIRIHHRFLAPRESSLPSRSASFSEQLRASEGAQHLAQIPASPCNFSPGRRASILGPPRNRIDPAVASCCQSMRITTQIRVGVGPKRDRPVPAGVFGGSLYCSTTLVCSASFPYLRKHSLSDLLSFLSILPFAPSLLVCKESINSCLVVF